MILKLMFDRRMRLALWAALLVSALVLAKCGSSGGMYQGGGDSTPGWR